MSHIAISPFRGTYYLNFKTGAIQRWAARLVKSGNYYALSPSLWKRAGLAELPEGIAGKVSPTQTMHFVDELSATKARDALLEHLTTTGVLK